MSLWSSIRVAFTDGLTARFDAAKARYESLDETIRSKQSRRATIETFLETLAKADLVDKFDTALWCGLVDFVTVHSKDDVRFTFKKRTGNLGLRPQDRNTAKGVPKTARTAQILRSYISELLTTITAVRSFLR